MVLNSKIFTCNEITAPINRDNYIENDWTTYQGCDHLFKILHKVVLLVIFFLSSAQEHVSVKQKLINKKFNSILQRMCVCVCLNSFIFQVLENSSLFCIKK